MSNKHKVFTADIQTYIVLYFTPRLQQESVYHCCKMIYNCQGTVLRLGYMQRILAVASSQVLDHSLTCPPHSLANMSGLKLVSYVVVIGLCIEVVRCGDTVGHRNS